MAKKTQVIRVFINSDKYRRWADDLSEAVDKVKKLLAHPPGIEIYSEPDKSEGASENS